MRRTLLLNMAVLLPGFANWMGAARAEEVSEEVAIRAANTAYYEALSARDIGAVERVWARQGLTFNIFGASRTPQVGWDAVRAGYEDLFNRFPELSVTMPEPLIAQNGDGALVVGVETLRGRLQNGEAANLLLPTTNVFIKRNGRWLIAHHHSSRPPQ